MKTMSKPEPVRSLFGRKYNLAPTPESKTAEINEIVHPISQIKG